MMHVVLVLFVLAAVLMALVLAPLSITKALLGDARRTKRSVGRKPAGHGHAPTLRILISPSRTCDSD
jgi:hypothetical protein